VPPRPHNAFSSHGYHCVELASSGVKDRSVRYEIARARWAAPGSGRPAAGTGADYQDGISKACVTLIMFPESSRMVASMP
jgi:hypothetical protein